MYVVTCCAARYVSREFGYTCSRYRSLHGRFVWRAPVRSPAGGFVSPGAAIADVISARLAIAKLVISLAPHCGSLVGAISWLAWILLYLAEPTYVQVRTCSVCLAKLSYLFSAALPQPHTSPASPSFFPHSNFRDG